MPDTDAREPRKIPNELRSVRETAAKDLASKIPGLQVEFDEITGGPKHLLASGRFLSDAVADLDEAAGLEPFAEIVGRYVDANEALFGHDSTELRSGRAWFNFQLDRFQRRQHQFRRQHPVAGDRCAWHLHPYGHQPGQRLYDH